jgi:hypothetical protein
MLFSRRWAATMAILLDPEYTWTPFVVKPAHRINHFHDATC